MFIDAEREHIQRLLEAANADHDRALRLAAEADSERRRIIREVDDDDDDNDDGRSSSPYQDPITILPKICINIYICIHVHRRSGL
jgi:hypothetical protein